MATKGIILDAAQSFWNATLDELDKVCNGCGPKKFGWLIPDVILGIDIGVACDAHDWDYNEGGDESDRLVADRRILKNMLAVIDAYHLSKSVRIRCKMMAYQYFAGVRFFGWTCFNYK